MRSKRLFLFLLMAFLAPWAVQAQGTANIPENGFINEDIVIRANAVVYTGDITITAGHTLTLESGAKLSAGAITVQEGAQLIINEGAELMHTTMDNVPVVLRMDADLNAAKDPDNSGYRLISCPVDGLSVVASGLTENFAGMDLYSFDQNFVGAEWRNYKDPAGHFDNFELKKGYLYYNSETVLGMFIGNAIPTNVSVFAPLAYNASATYAGWNLLGNPYTCSTRIYANPGCTQEMGHYVLNAEGNEIVTTSVTEPIAPTKGFFVVAEEANQVCYFWTALSVTAAAPQALEMTLSANRGSVVDAACVRFDNAARLPKVQLNPNHTKIYMTEGDKDYAVTNAAQTGELPVNIKVENSGSYTLNFTNTNVEFTYLHLIDNLLGTDVNLLTNPNYTFEALSTDYASRFRLVYATGASKGSESEPFGFFNYNGDFCVFGIEGEATLQVIDMMGRVISSEPFLGSYESKLNVTPGVYMLRLVNGNDVRVQKTVVK